jgi:hypothetical protein
MGMDIRIQQIANSDHELPFIPRPIWFTDVPYIFISMLMTCNQLLIQTKPCFLLNPLSGSTSPLMSKIIWCWTEQSNKVGCIWAHCHLKGYNHPNVLNVYPCSLTMREKKM